MPRENILVVDDDPASLGYMSLALSGEFENLRAVGGSHEALLAMENSLPDLVITDLHMPEPDGLALLRLIKERWPEVPVIVVTVDQEIPTVVEAVRQGAINYLPKPVSPAVLLATARRALVTAGLGRKARGCPVPEIVGASPAMVRVRHFITLAARSDVNVLITGATGTGKELVARAIHRLSSVAQCPFVPHNCAVSPHDLFESLFFGHHRGAFTGADRDQRGLLQEAHGGILFLDELESLNPSHQAKLLRVLDDGQVEPVGSVERWTVSVRFLSATNRDPTAMLAQGTLRDDLYYRLRGLEIQVPPLRHRREDIPALASHFLAGSGCRVTPAAMEALSAYTWPGNVRQLRNVLQGARTAATTGWIDRSHLVLGSHSTRMFEPDAPAESLGRELTGTGGHTLKEIERQALLDALRVSGGRRGQAARLLGIHRSTLLRKMREFRITSTA